MYVRQSPFDHDKKLLCVLPPLATNNNGDAPSALPSLTPGLSNISAVPRLFLARVRTQTKQLCSCSCRKKMGERHDDQIAYFWPSCFLFLPSPCFCCNTPSHRFSLLIQGELVPTRGTLVPKLPKLVVSCPKGPVGLCVCTVTIKRLRFSIGSP